MQLFLTNAEISVMVSVFDSKLLVVIALFNESVRQTIVSHSNTVIKITLKNSKLLLLRLILKKKKIKIII